MSAATKPEGRLPGALNQLHNAVAALCSPQTRYLDNQTRTAPALYNQLRDTITGLHNTGYNGAHQSQPPIWADAFDLLQEIDTAAEVWHPQLAGIPPTVGRLKSLAKNGKTGSGWRPDDLHQIGQITKACEQWAAQISGLLDPDNVKHFRSPDGEGFAACPQCGKKTTYRVDPSDGESKRVPVLQWIAESGTTCIVCRAHWAPDMTLFVSQLLGFELPEGVLE